MANFANVSTTTISRYLNGKYDAMSEDTKARIHNAIQVLNYNPNHMARGLRNDKSYTIGFVVADIGNSYSISVIRGFEETCSKFGYSIIVCNSDESADKERECLQMLISRQIDAIAINSTGQNNDLLLSISESIPVLLIDRKLPELSFDTVSTNNFQGMQLAVEHLLSRGCSTISLMIKNPDGISPRYERVNAFNSITQKNDVRLRQAMLKVVESYDSDSLTRYIKDVMDHQSSQNKVGFILGNGTLSLMALKAVHQLNYRVPEELLLIGFDDPEWASIARPTLSCIVQPTCDIGRQSAELIISRINNNLNNVQAKTIELPVNLMERESTSGNEADSFLV
ncbi:LacI family DNA-binding transcriptional regulator [Bacillus salipaludis]|uniref:LacI family DNA-binding transcriptional regulator n=1 Tax=Bacillus salipaludis TaxID=2547811 RepID=A0ABW8RK37_9BACI